MAVIPLTINEIVDNCPEFDITDGTDYSTPEVYCYSDFKFHDYYGGGTPDANTTFTLDTFVFGPHAFTGVTIDIETDGTSNIINAEIQYLALKTALEGVVDGDQRIEFIQPDNTGYRDWYLRISSDNPSYATQAVSVNTSGGSITPLFTTITDIETVTSRSLTLLDSEGNVIDLGAVAQVDTLVLENSTYTEGQVFTLSFCSDDITYTITSENSAECVAAGIAEAVNTSTIEKVSTYLEATVSGTNVLLSAKIAGVPLDLSFVYAEGGMSLSTTIVNVPSMGLPNFSNSDTVTYTPKERGGKYTASLYVVSDCDYNTVTRDFYNWCYDLSEFDCCFVKLVKNVGCCCKTKEKQREASYLRNVIYAIDKMLEKGESEANIQSVIDFGWSICQPLKCECKTC